MKELIAFLHCELIGSVTISQEEIKELLSFIDFFQRERKTDIFYIEEHVTELISYIQDDEYISLADRLRMDFQSCSICETKSLREYGYLYVNLNERCLTEENNHLIAKLANTIQTEKQNSIVLITPSFSKYCDTKGFISIIKHEYKNADKQYPQLINVECLQNIEQLERWINQNRQPRNMNKNNKHGENGTGAHKNSKNNPVSKLYGSIADAQKLLDNAIGDVREDKRKLLNYDENEKKFILFYYEGDTPSNQYHAFHVINEQEIDNELKDSLAILKKRHNL